MTLNLFFILFLILSENNSNSNQVNNFQGLCHNSTCIARDIFNCGCKSNENWYKTREYCIPLKYLCDGYCDCPDGSDEIDCYCSDNQFQCSYCNPGRECGEQKQKFDYIYQCIPLDRVNDTHADCLNRKDDQEERASLNEIISPSPLQHCNDSLKCDGYLDCLNPFPHDEFNCSGCPSNLPIPCDCNKENKSCVQNGFVCFSEKKSSLTIGYAVKQAVGGRYDGVYDCSDQSDENNCSCSANEFLCHCYKNAPATCKNVEQNAASLNFTRCIPRYKYHDGRIDCLDGSDETQFLNYDQFGDCDVTIHRFANISECKAERYPSCNTSTCYQVPSVQCLSQDCNLTDVICTSNHSCNQSQAFQCNEGTLLLASSFCDGKVDCFDRSDEISNGPGFRCRGSQGICILPQRNLYDKVAQCSDNSDIPCTNDCFKCLDNRLLISSKQLCDGRFDCYDLSDECLCQRNIHNDRCNSMLPTRYASIIECYDNTNHSKSKHKNLSKIRCQTKYKEILATMCDGRPECRDFSDECNCDDPPAFCKDPCHEFYLMGDRYCDGIEDEASKFIYRSNCSKGFDELNCPKRFMCKAENKVSIDIFKKCDGVKDCDQNEDEINCNRKNKYFASNKEMIGNKFFRVCFWIMGVLIICGNIFVIITSVLYLKNQSFSKINKLQRLIVLNISIADIVMGIYLLLITVFSVVYSEHYVEVDHKWRSSLRCSLIGSLTVISSETSCLMMVLLTTFRLHQIRHSFQAEIIPTKPWKIAIVLVWLISVTMAILPIFPEYFVREIWFSSKFENDTILNKLEITKFSCRLAQFTNKSIQGNGRDWKLTKVFFENNFPGYAPGGEFGYYGETSVCMPRFYLNKGDNAWEYTLFLITLNFISFLYIALSYIYIFKTTTQNHDEHPTLQRVAIDKTLQNRIARLILTDFFCWVPICLTSYMKIIGVHVSHDFYIISATLLLPINSLINPLLFSPLYRKLKNAVKRFASIIKSR